MATNISNLDIGLVVGSFGGIVRRFSKASVPTASLASSRTRPGRPSAASPWALCAFMARPRATSSSPAPSVTPRAVTIRWRSRNGRKARIAEHIFYGKEEEQRGTWSHYGAEADGVWFYLEDSTGRVLVNPHGAEYELERTGMREVGEPTASSFAAGGVSDTELLAYVARVGPTPMIPGLLVTPRNGNGRTRILNTRSNQITPEELFEEMVGPQLAQRRAQMQQALEAEGPQSDPRDRGGPARHDRTQ